MKGWRTIAANALAAGIAWANAQYGWLDLTGDEQAAAVVTLLAIVNMGLRTVTTTGLGKAK